MPWNLLILPLLGGYSFIHLCYRLRFRSQRLEGYRLLIEAALWGVLLAVCARVALFLFLKTPIGPPLASVCRQLAPFPFAGTAVGAFLLGLSLPFPINRWLFNKEEAKRQAISQLKDPMLRLLYESAEFSKAILVTLDNRKIYAGYVLNAPNLERENVHLGLLPLLSGHRDHTTLDIRFTVDYISVYESEGVDKNSFMLVIPLAHVRSAHFFNLKVYVDSFLQAGHAGAPKLPTDQT